MRVGICCGLESYIAEDSLAQAKKVINEITVDINSILIHLEKNVVL